MKNYKIIIIVVVLVFLFIFTACKKKKVKDAGIELTVNLADPPIENLMTDITYTWKLKKNVIKYDPEYKVFVHFWDNTQSRMIAQDDHNLPGDVEKWKPGAIFTYTHKNFYIPDFIDEYDPNFSGEEEVTLTVGLWKPGVKNSGIVIYQKKMYFQPINPEFPDYTYDEGWYPEEKFGDGIYDSWRWTAKDAVISVENIGKDIKFYFWGGVDKSIFKDQKVIVKVNNTLIDEFIPEEGKFKKEYVIKKDLIGNGDEFKVTISTDKTFIPAVINKKSNDQRELGVQVFFVYFKPAS